jgi:methylenetetrahydrofolate reductase (NADPH)
VVAKKDQSEEGIKFALEQVEEFKEMEGIASVLPRPVV